MFKRSLLSLVLIAGFACPAAHAEGEELLIAAADSASVIVDVADEAVSIVAEGAADVVAEVAPEALSAAAKVIQMIKDNKVALGAAVVATAGAVAVAAWYYGYFQTAENNQAENNQVA